jgi:hypothetical protein
MATGGMKQMGKRLIVLNDLNNSQLTQAEAAELLNVFERKLTSINYLLPLGGITKP